MKSRFPRVASLRTPEGLRAHATGLGLDLPCDDRLLAAPDSPLAAPLALGSRPTGGGECPLTAPNRFVIQPMEGWDGTPDGQPSELTLRRWRNFGRSGAGWIWGGEAVAVRPDGRANPNQLVIDERNAPAIAGLREALLEAASEAGRAEPVVGLQLTHSGRWSIPSEAGRRPRIAYRHPILDRRVGVVDDRPVLSDDELESLVDAFVTAARLAAEAGFDFVDVKHCHGYLLHELLSARTRPGRHGGEALEARTRLGLRIVQAIRTAVPALRIGVRLSLFDSVPFRHHESGGEPEPHPIPYPYGFGLDPERPLERDLAEPIAFVESLRDAGVSWINVTAASPYYAPHAQRPATFPPSDGYSPPEDPLIGVARLLAAARELKQAVPEVTVVSSGWTYLQDFVGHVAQAMVRDGWFDAVGLGRMALSYPELPADLLAGRPLARKRICRTFSDCTTAPRNGLISGCYPLDPFYRERPEREQLESLKREARES